MPSPEEALCARVQKLLSQTAVLKLNGGLGTSMGLEKAKSLLEVKDGKTFLDLIAEQIKHTRKQFGSQVGRLVLWQQLLSAIHKLQTPGCGSRAVDLTRSLRLQVRFVLMNSFSTSEDTKEHLAKAHGDLLKERNLELLQNKSPKIDAKSLEPITFPEDPDLEWYASCCCSAMHSLINAYVSASRGRSCLNTVLTLQYTAVGSESQAAPLSAQTAAHIQLVMQLPFASSAVGSMPVNVAGVHPATETSTLPCWARDSLTASSRMASSTCSCPTPTTWVPPWIWTCSPTLLLRTRPSSWRCASRISTGRAVLI